MTTISQALTAEFAELDRVTPRPLTHEDYAIAAIQFHKELGNFDLQDIVTEQQQTIEEQAAELEQLRSERDKRGKWISVDENPPAYTVQEYFRQAEGELIPIFVTDGKTSWIGNKSGDIYMFKALFPTVTHWMEIELPTSALSGGSKQ